MRGSSYQNTPVTQQQTAPRTGSRDTTDAIHYLSKEMLVPLGQVLNESASEHIGKEAFFELLRMQLLVIDGQRCTGQLKLSCFNILSSPWITHPQGRRDQDLGAAASQTSTDCCLREPGCFCKKGLAINILSKAFITILTYTPIVFLSEVIS